MKQNKGVRLSAIPNFCAHEHWGSIDSIGSVDEGFRADVECGALPARETDLSDLLLDPYFRGCLAGSGEHPDAMARQAGAHDFRAWAARSRDDAFARLWAAIDRQRLVGVFQSIRNGVLALYNTDLADGPPPEQLDAAIAENYRRPFQWYRDVMAKAHFTHLIRPIHPEFYFREETPESAREERAFTMTLMRIDPLMELWPAECPRRRNLAAQVGVEPVDAPSWRAFIAAVFDLAAQHGVLGIKQLQAYSRTLEFLPRDDREVTFSGDLSPEQVRVFQDWVAHACCREAHAREWPHQIHVGTHNMPNSNPLPLAALAVKYPGMKIVMLHCWPYLAEAAHLAMAFPNVYIDTCWQVILNPEFYREALRMWLNYVPLHKIMCSHDATSIEMAVGASIQTRELLAEALENQAGVCGPHTKLERVALALLYNNAAGLYRRGEPLIPSCI
ncbi:MAG TPA: amidohydrolase family protein [Candidatus Hydrogenedentes bacterium]|nr:amidohydrolase family protein [Candidatus Hydrogenedentota bacterium]